MKVKANIAARADAYKTAWFAVNNYCNKITDIANSGKKAEIDLINIKLVKFGIYTKTSLADSICKTCYKWVIDDFAKYNNNNFITLLIINIKA